jgi:hypothetical protein
MLADIPVLTLALCGGVDLALDRFFFWCSLDLLFFWPSRILAEVEAFDVH